MRTLSVIFLLPVGCLLLGLVSCGDDGEDIVGIWQLYSRDGEIVGEYGDVFFEFDGDGTFTLTLKEGQSTESVTGTYSLSDDVVTIIAEDEPLTGTWVIKGNTLTLTTVDLGVWIFKKTDKT